MLGVLPPISPSEAPVSIGSSPSLDEPLQVVLTSYPFDGLHSLPSSFVAVQLSFACRHGFLVPTCELASPQAREDEASSCDHFRFYEVPQSASPK